MQNPWYIKQNKIKTKTKTVKTPQFYLDQNTKEANDSWGKKPHLVGYQDQSACPPPWTRYGLLNKRFNTQKSVFKESKTLLFVTDKIVLWIWKAAFDKRKIYCQQFDTIV